MAEGEADQTIITRFIVEASEALQNSIDLRKRVDEAKMALIALNNETKRNFKDLAEGMKEAFETSQMKEFEKEIGILRTTATSAASELQKNKVALDLKPQEVKAQTKQIQQALKDDIGTALDMARAKVAQYNADVNRALNEVLATERTSAKEIQVQKQLEGEARKKSAQDVKLISQQQTTDYRAMVANQEQSEQEWQSFLKAKKQEEKATNKQVVNEKLRNIEQQVVAQKEIDKANKDNTKSTQDLGSTLRYVFGALFGITIFGIIRNFISQIKQAVESGLEFAKALYAIAVGVNVLRRSGLDITVADVTENIQKLRKEFGIFSTKELVQGTAALLNLVRDFGFTKDQIFSLQEAISTLAVVNGRAMDEVQRTVALAISSGYTEGLQRLGVSINRVTIAMEAQRLGFGRSYMSLTEQQRATATYNLILAKTAKYQDDLLSYQNTAPGRIDKATAAWKDLYAVLGERILPTYATLADWSVRLAEGIRSTTGIIGYMIANFMAMTVAIATVVEAKAKAMWSALSGNPEALNYDPVEMFNKKYKEIFTEALKVALPDIFAPEINQAELQDQLDKASSVIDTHLDEVEQLQKDSADRRIEIERDYQRDLAQFVIEGNQRVLDLQTDFFRDLDNLALKETQDIADAWDKYYFDLQGIAIDTNNKIADTNEKYREQELKAEEDYQEKLRRLREDFLMDLEDALRARDALQVIRLTRRYNLEKDRLERNYETEAEQRQRAQEQELKDIQEARREKELELKRELEFRLKNIAIEAERERKAREVQYQRDLADLAIALGRQRVEAQIKRDQMLSDLDADYNARLQLIATKLATELALYKLENDTIIKMIMDTFGPGGIALSIIQAYADARAAILSQNDVYNPSNVPEREYGTGNTRQFGGPVSTGQPYKVHKDETFIPAVNGRILSVKQSQEVLGRSGGGSGNGKLEIALLLSPDLEARIVDDTLDSMANVFVTVQRAQT